MLVPTSEIKKYEEPWSNIRDLIWSITKNSDDCDEKYMKIKFNSHDDLPLNKTTEIPSIVIVVRTIFHFFMKTGNVISAGKIRFFGAQSLCSSKQVHENVEHLKILCTLRLFEVHKFTTLCTLPCTKLSILWKDEAVQ